MVEPQPVTDLVRDRRDQVEGSTVDRNRKGLQEPILEEEVVGVDVDAGRADRAGWRARDKTVGVAQFLLSKWIRRRGSSPTREGSNESGVTELHKDSASRTASCTFSSSRLRRTDVMTSTPETANAMRSKLLDGRWRGIVVFPTVRLYSIQRPAKGRAIGGLDHSDTAKQRHGESRAAQHGWQPAAAPLGASSVVSGAHPRRSVSRTCFAVRRLNAARVSVGLAVALVGNVLLPTR
jgi:hypothetical protein